MRLATLALLVAVPAAAQTVTLPEADVAAIEAAIADEMAAKNLPSVAVGIRIPGRGDYVAAKGAANLETGAPREAGDPFRIGSVTKTMIGTVILQLAQEGALALGDPIATWFPDYPNAGEITVDDLLRMRSGIWDSWTDEALDVYYADPLHPPSMDEMIARSAAEGARFTPPDVETIYVNMNFILLDKIIAAVTGAPTSEALQARVFGPLGMTASELPEASALPGPLRGYGWNAAAKATRTRPSSTPARWAARGQRSRRWTISRRSPARSAPGRCWSPRRRRRGWRPSPSPAATASRATAGGWRSSGRSAATTARSWASRPRPGTCRPRTRWSSST